MIGAIKQSNGKYTLTDIKYDVPHLTTYSRRKQIKDFGGVWDGTKKQWIDFPENKLKEILAVKRFKIRTEPYAGVDKPEDSFAWEHQIKNNTVQRIDWGDCWISVKIQEIYGEQ